MMKNMMVVMIIGLTRNKSRMGRMRPTMTLAMDEKQRVWLKIQ
jgi:hypothetical protein